MELSGTVSENLRAAITSARRLRGRHVHQDTLDFWHELLAFARTRVSRSTAGEGDLRSFIADLESELAARTPDAG